jgi:hypothetical protein
LKIARGCLPLRLLGLNWSRSQSTASIMTLRAI